MAETNNSGKVSLGNESFFKSIGGWSAVGNAADKVSNLLPPPNEYKGDKGNITLSIDLIYNKASDIAMLINPAVGGIMKANAFLNKGMKLIGGGTDGMTTTDAILGSSLLAPIGWVNGFGGSKTDTIQRDYNAFATVGSSYDGMSNAVTDAEHYSGKKYGLFSAGSKNKANNFIHKIGLQQTNMSDIANDTTMNNNMLANLSAIAGYLSGFELGGGYDMSTTRAAKNGMKFSKSNITHLRELLNKPQMPIIEKHEEGGNLRMNIISKPLPKKVSRVIRLAKLGNKLKNKKSFIANFDFEDTPVLIGHENEDPNYISVKDLLRLQELTPKEEISNGSGGFSHSIDDINKTVNVNGVNYIYKGIDDTGKELFVGPDGGAYYFKDGGLMNVIPEGALHKNKHHMENDENITKKGIPVVVEKSNGELNLQAEIERDEIIFNYEITKKLEELNKKYQSENSTQKEKDEVAIEAGKLLADEILNNTDDRTGLILTIE